MPIKFMFDDTDPEPIVPDPVEGDGDDDLDAWVTAKAKAYISVPKPLKVAEHMYQPVDGTSSGSVYRVCFLGPELRAAARIQETKLSFRFTTVNGTCPDGDLKAALETLGVTGVFEDRMTVHVHMKRTYEENAAEYRATLGAFYAALLPWITSEFPAADELKSGVA